MTLFQKLKIKLFGKERWRVVGGNEVVSKDDFVVTNMLGSKHVAVTMRFCPDGAKASEYLPDLVYRKVN